MCSAAILETPFIPILMGHPELQERLLARMSALLATALRPTEALATLDLIYQENNSALLADHRRWELELDNPSPERSLSEMRSFIMARPDHLIQHLAQHTGRKARVVHVDVPGIGIGEVRVEGLSLSEGHHAMVCFSDVPMTFEAIPAAGMEFAGWEGRMGAAGTMRLDPTEYRFLKPRFRILVP